MGGRCIEKGANLLLRSVAYSARLEVSAVISTGLSKQLLFIESTPQMVSHWDNVAHRIERFVACLYSLCCWTVSRVNASYIGMKPNAFHIQAKFQRSSAVPWQIAFVLIWLDNRWICNMFWRQHLTDSLHQQSMARTWIITIIIWTVIALIMHNVLF